MTRRTLLAASFAALVAASLPVRAQTGDALARSVQAHYDSVKDFTADFEQSYVGGALKRKTVERGTVAIRKPGRMRWDYTAPEKKLFVSDGTRMYFYVPADRQVRVSALPADGRVPTPILFLAGRGDLLRDFKVEEVAGSGGASVGTIAPGCMYGNSGTKLVAACCMVCSKLARSGGRSARGGGITSGWASVIKFSRLRAGPSV